MKTSSIIGMKPGVYLNTYQDRGDLILITNKEIPVECPDDLEETGLNLDVHIGRRRVMTLIFKDLEYLGEL